MGQPKDQLLVQGEPLIERQCALLINNRHVSDTVYVSGNGKYALPEGCAWVADCEMNQGPIQGILSCMKLSFRDCTHVLVVAVDLPAMTCNYLEKLCRHLDLNNVTVPYHSDLQFYEPLCAIYPIGEFHRLKAWYDAGQRSLQKYLRQRSCDNQLTAIPIESGEKACFANINTPDEYAQFLQAKR